MNTSEPVNFPIRFGKVYRLLSKALLMSPSQSYLRIEGDVVSVRMGWGFRARFPRSAIQRISESQKRHISRGVHGFAGKWLVNGSGDGMLSMELEPVQRAHVLGVPVHLRELVVSVDQPVLVAETLAERPSQTA